MRSSDITLALTSAAAVIGILGVVLSPIPPAYALLAGAAVAVGAAWDLRRRHPVPRRLLTLLGMVGFVVSLFPLNREMLAEQSLAALSILLAVKMLEKKLRRDHLQVMALSVMMVAGGASLAPELSFALLFAADLLIGVLLLLWLPFDAHLGGARVERGFLRRLGTLAGLLVILALPLGVVTFMVLPRSLNPFWGGMGPAGQRVSGFSDEIRLGEVGRISLSPEVAFRAEMTDPPGPLDDTPYWRGLVLEETDGRVWRALPSAQGALLPGSAAQVRITYYVEPHGERELFLLEQPLTAMAGFRVLQTSTGGVLRIRRPLLTPFRYQGISRPSPLRPSLLTGREQALNLELPRDFSPRIRALAREAAAGETGPERLITRLAAFLGDGFTYSLQVPPATGDPLEAFLFDHRTGYCEYFASALALMLRAEGVPARVVAGYLGGEYNQGGNYYLVRQASAHAWVEAFVEGQGWLRVDPTPAAGELGATLAARGAPATVLWLDLLRMRWNSWVVQYDLESQVGLVRTTRRSMGRSLESLRAHGAAAALTVLGAVFASLALGRLRRPSPRDPLGRRYRRFSRLLAREGIGRPPHQGPLDHALQAARALPGAEAPILGFIRAYLPCRYRTGAAGKSDLESMDGYLSELGRSLGRRSRRGAPREPAR